MTIDPEKGFHIGTLTSCILSVIAQAMNNCLILPSLPFLVKMYYPDVYELHTDMSCRLTSATLVTILDFFCLHSI